MSKKTQEKSNKLELLINKGFDNAAAQMAQFKAESDKKSEHVDVRFTLLGSKLMEHDKRFDTIEKKIDQTWNLIDGYVKSQEDFREEFKTMKHKMTQIQKIIKSKLGVEIE
ncbi:MAG: hypothetical protein PHQ47_01615 [Candidatus Portnoybacteria bacterium]|nr:hypothetical protein [Candidatus Portnoybacteria bacterium]